MDGMRVSCPARFRRPARSSTCLPWRSIGSPTASSPNTGRARTSSGSWYSSGSSHFRSLGNSPYALMFKVVLIEAAGDRPSVRMAELDDGDLPDCPVTVDVAYSSLNYKDALAISGKAPIARKLPMVAGIDLAGTVAESEQSDFSAGDEVVVTGYGLGEVHWGGLAERARLEPDWIVPLPQPFNTHQAMQVGTAGFTAMLCVLALEDHGLAPDGGQVLVTGSGGGVGGIAIALLAKLGYEVVASTGRSSEADYLRGLGASEVIDRDELSEPGKP